MANRHYRKWWFQMPIGFLLVSAGIFAIVYFIEKRPNTGWQVWAVSSIIVLNVGLGFLGSSFMHKLKSDLIRRERNRHQSSVDEEM